jgi:hypothetical protein
VRTAQEVQSAANVRQWRSVAVWCCCCVHLCCWCAVRGSNSFRLAILVVAVKALDLPNFVADKLPDSGTLLPKYVAVGS